MPQVRGVRHRFDNLVQKTVLLEPGELADFDFTPQGAETYSIAGFGLRVLDTTQEQEQPLLDHLELWCRLGRMGSHGEHGPFPGTILSTFRTIVEPLLITGEYAQTVRAAGRPAANHQQMAWATMPGYVLLRPIIVPVRMLAKLVITADKQLPRPCAVRALVFGLRTKDWKQPETSEDAKD